MFCEQTVKYLLLLSIIIVWFLLSAKGPTCSKELKEVWWKGQTNDIEVPFMHAYAWPDFYIHKNIKVWFLLLWCTVTECYADLLLLNILKIKGLSTIIWILYVMKSYSSLQTKVKRPKWMNKLCNRFWYKG